jgi:hypothetical protein
LGACIGWAAAARTSVQPDAGGDDALALPGTWTVLVASLLFFGVQYWLGYRRATQPDLVRELPLKALAPFASALGAGFFAGRAGALLRLHRRLGRRAASGPDANPSAREAPTSPERKS